MYTVRPFSRPARSDLKDVHRIYLSSSALPKYNLKPGDVCRLQKGEDQPLVATAWPAVEKIRDDIVQVSKQFQELHSLKLGEKISIKRDGSSIPDAENVTAIEVPLPGQDTEVVPMSEKDRAYWELFLEYPFEKAEILSVGMTFEAVESKG